ncbi:5,6-dimethylbenzimidazole synthase, partial [Streptomyces sp. NPDC086080]
MTDTGQVPGEGLPENAGMVEQPGVLAPDAYTYLSDSPAEDEDLLLPGAQSAWGNEIAPPVPEPVVETVHAPGPHEMSGRDSGSVDLGGVRLPDPDRPQTAAAAPRRPLHLGPPIPDVSASPVRSLADRGPADLPARHPGPPTLGPEYLDIPRAREAAAPHTAAPWNAQATGGAVAPVAEPAVPSAHPQGAAQAVVTRVASEAVAVQDTEGAGVAAGASAAEYAETAGAPVASGAPEAGTGAPAAVPEDGRPDEMSSAVQVPGTVGAPSAEATPSGDPYTGVPGIDTSATVPPAEVAPENAHGAAGLPGEEAAAPETGHRTESGPAEVAAPQGPDAALPVPGAEAVPETAQVTEAPQAAVEGVVPEAAAAGGVSEAAQVLGEPQAAPVPGAEGVVPEVPPVVEVPGAAQAGGVPEAAQVLGEPQAAPVPGAEGVVPEVPPV